MGLTLFPYIPLVLYKFMTNLIGLCSDHAGYKMKELVKGYLLGLGLEVMDYGCFSEERADYPDFAHLMGKAIDQGELSRGIAFCGSGNGISMALNKHPHVRAALCWTVELAELARQHNNANVLSLPARFIDEDLCKAVVNTFLNSSFEGGRHEARIHKIPL